MPKKPKNWTPGTLTHKQSAAIAALLAHPTIEQAAAAAGVGVRTLYTWVNEPAFRDELRQAQARIIEQAQNRLVTGQSAALDALEWLVVSAQSESVKRQAAEGWLNLMFKYREAGALEERITALEQKVGQNEKV